MAGFHCVNFEDSIKDHSQNYQFIIDFAQKFLQDLDLRLKNIVPCETYKTAVSNEFIKKI